MNLDDVSRETLMPTLWITLWVIIVSQPTTIYQSVQLSSCDSLKLNDYPTYKIDENKYQTTRSGNQHIHYHVEISG